QAKRRGCLKTMISDYRLCVIQIDFGRLEQRDLDYFQPVSRRLRDCGVGRLCRPLGRPQTEVHSEFCHRIYPPVIRCRANENAGPDSVSVTSANRPLRDISSPLIIMGIVIEKFAKVNTNISCETHLFTGSDAMPSHKLPFRRICTIPA
ncbi:hypothetical protein, partial [Rhizobium leguminosarum]|uniref:hypothetical protein n=1 Tax=Rhizobium leguminosarum TaxID=384 RepID=UPI00195443E9